MTHICVSSIITIGSDNGLSPGRRQTIIWTHTRILLIGPLGINFSEIAIEINTFSFQKIDFKMSSAKWWPSFLGLIVLTVCHWIHSLARGMEYMFEYQSPYQYLLLPLQRLLAIQSAISVSTCPPCLLQRQKSACGVLVDSIAHPNASIVSYRIIETVTMDACITQCIHRPQRFNSSCGYQIPTLALITNRALLLNPKWKTNREIVHLKCLDLYSSKTHKAIDAMV